MKKAIVITLGVIIGVTGVLAICAYLDCIREELPHEATTGFRFRTITQDPAVRKAVDDIVFDLYGEENPCREEDYDLAPSEEMQMGGM